MQFLYSVWARLTSWFFWGASKPDVLEEGSATGCAEALKSTAVDVRVTVASNGRITESDAV